MITETCGRKCGNGTQKNPAETQKKTHCKKVQQSSPHIGAYTNDIIQGIPWLA